MADTVLLTGISGFLGGHIALQLLAAGYRVRGSLRRLDRADQVRASLARAGADTTRLDFVALTLTADTGWTKAMAGCRYLQHTASPVMVTAPRDPAALIGPAVEGTRRAITAALAAGVERIVLTSSIAAIQYGHDAGRLLTEADWSDLASPATNAYARSKTLAERTAWSLMDAANRHADLAVINPAIILGPLLDADPGASPVLIQRLLLGHIPAVPRLDLPRALATAFPGARLPRVCVPDWLVRLYAQFNPDVRASLPELGRRRAFAPSRAADLLGRPLIPASQAAIATGHSLSAFGLLSHP